jgi:hypothetical protein
MFGTTSVSSGWISSIWSDWKLVFVSDHCTSTGGVRSCRIAVRIFACISSSLELSYSTGMPVSSVNAEETYSSRFSCHAPPHARTVIESGFGGTLLCDVVPPSLPLSPLSVSVLPSPLPEPPEPPLHPANATAEAAPADARNRRRPMFVPPSLSLLFSLISRFNRYLLTGIQIYPPYGSIFIIPAPSASGVSKYRFQEGRS